VNAFSPISGTEPEKTSGFQLLKEIQAPPTNQFPSASALGVLVSDDFFRSENTTPFFPWLGPETSETHHRGDFFRWCPNSAVPREIKFNGSGLNLWYGTARSSGRHEEKT